MAMMPIEVPDVSTFFTPKLLKALNKEASRTPNLEKALFLQKDGNPPKKESPVFSIDKRRRRKPTDKAPSKEIKPEPAKKQPPLKKKSSPKK